MTDTVGVAILGAGHWGPNLIRAFHEGAGSVVRRVVDRDPARLAAVADRFPEILLGTDATEALADPQVDAVVVATPTSTHHDLGRAALLAGKHLLVEKPLAASVEEASSLCSLAEDLGLVLMVGHVFLFNPAVRRVKEILDAGDLGRVYHLSMVRTNLGPIRVDVDAAWDLAAHDLSIAGWWLGNEPVAVSAVGGSWINEGVADAVFATLHYPGGVVANLHASWLNPRKVRDITVVGAHRMLTLDDMDLDEPVRVYDKGVDGEPSEHGYVDTFASFRASVHEGPVSIPRVEGAEPLRSECDHFIECVRSGCRPLSGGSEGLAVVRALDAISCSMRRGGASVTLA